jgi:hypothetical protein
VTVGGADRLRKALPRCTIPFPRLRDLPELGVPGRK